MFSPVIITTVPSRMFLSQIKNIAKRNIREGTVVIITGENTIKLAGNEVSNHLTDAAIDNHIIVTGAASYENLESCISQSKEFNAGLDLRT